MAKGLLPTLSTQLQTHTHTLSHTLVTHKDKEARSDSHTHTHTLMFAWSRGHTHIHKHWQSIKVAWRGTASGLVNSSNLPQETLRHTAPEAQIIGTERDGERKIGEANRDKNKSEREGKTA